MSKQPQVKPVKPGDDIFSAECDAVSSSIPGRCAVADTGRSQALVQAAFPESTTSDKGIEEDAVTIGDALEAAAIVSGNKPIDYSDADAVAAAEMRATGLAVVAPGGVGAAARAAAERNALIEKEREEEMTSMSDVLGNAAAVLPAKVVRREDAVSIRSAEEQSRWAGDGKEPGFGVATAIMEASELNEDGIFWQDK